MRVEQAQGWIAQARRVVAFTGAGISTESGIPDFRSPNGVWARNRTIYFDEFVRNEQDRIEYWRQKVDSWPAMRNAAPNEGHLALVNLARQGKLRALITQNIDGLHQRSGLDPALILELHGTTTEAVCLQCADRIPIGQAVPPNGCRAANKPRAAVVAADCSSPPPSLLGNRCLRMCFAKQKRLRLPVRFSSP